MSSLIVQVIKFLLDNRRLEIGCLNMKKYTPLDAQLKAPRRSGYTKCKKILLGAGAKRAKELTQALATTHPKNTWKAHANWLNGIKSTLMVVAILIVTVTFQAAFNPPGGVWQDDYPPLLSPGEDKTKIDQWHADNKDYIRKNEHFAGEAVMSSESPSIYLLFCVFNLISLLSSAGIILLLTSGYNLKRRALMWVLMIAVWISTVSIGISYVSCLYYLTNQYALAYVRLQYGSDSATAHVISMVAALALIGPLVTAYLVRLAIRLYKKLKRRAGSAGNRDGAAIQVMEALLRYFVPLSLFSLFLLSLFIPFSLPHDRTAAKVYLIVSGECKEKRGMGNFCREESEEAPQEKQPFEMSNYERIEAARKKKEEGNILFKGGKYRQAMRRYDKVLDVESHNVKALYRWAQAYMETTDLDLAELDVKKARELDNKNRELKSIQKTLKQPQVQCNRRDAKLYSNMFVQMRKETTAEVKVMFSDNF
ncbi:hypothetical protein MRB53_027861 [Persea americana]|uniref:Uncharacterized protein n=1 Tax=Persea americana TaxID=3435 RepID=A0ACC2KDW8_PERAE|nr:hypothetical protein MRB53_027861 [Persea americana]